MNMLAHRRLPLLAATVTLIVHAIANPHYGFFRDELYFIICGRHPAFGYVDQPPVIPLIAAFTQIFGHSLFLLRLVPALCAAASVYVSCLLVVELGGGVFAQVLTSIAVAVCPVLLTFGTMLTTDAMNLWLWPLIALWLLRISKGADARWWLAIGAALGCSALTKYSVLFFGVALLIGLVLTPQRRILVTPWFAAGMALAAAMILPNFLWQAHYGFPMLELLRNGQLDKNIVLSPPAYLLSELLITGPLLWVVWIFGLVWMLARPPFRWLGYAYVTLIVMMIVAHGKHYYPADVYPYLFAAGSIAIESLTIKRQALRTGIASLALATSAIIVPYALPILPERAFIRYDDAVGFARAAASEHARVGVMPWQNWADMHGWPEMAATVARVYAALPSNERARAAIVARNYGEAAAIDFFGTAYGLPAALSGHNQYYLWGSRGFSGDVLIAVGWSAADLKQTYDDVTPAATLSSPYARPGEGDGIVYLCRHPRRPLNAVWPAIRFYE